jgi:predicted RNA-binding protein YlxR (DUF448 family)
VIRAGPPSGPAGAGGAADAASEVADRSSGRPAERATLLVATSRGADPSCAPGDRTSRSVPVRTCVGCRARSAATGLLRVVVVSGVLTPDPRRRLPGRGAWLHPDPECLLRAERRRAFPRALRVPGPLAVDEVRRYLRPTPKCEPASHLDHESQDDPS